MHISISISSSYPDHSPDVAARQMIERARVAEQAGLSAMFIGDHHGTPTNYMQNNAMLGRLLAEWGSRPYGALYLLPLWHPVLLAEQIGTLAALAPGRFIMQCGLGDRRQCRAMGIDSRERVPRFEAMLRVMRALWNGERVSEHRFWCFEDTRIAPVPEQTVNVWIGALAPAAIARAARLGDGWLGAPSLTPEQAREAACQYADACADLSKPIGAVALRRDLFIGKDMQDAQRVVSPYIAAGYRGMASEALLYGDVAAVSAQLEDFADMGYTDICVRNISSDQHEALATIERLALVLERLNA